MTQHISVLLEETVQALVPLPGKVYVDATLGGGGHSLRLCDFLDASNTLAGLDQDPKALEKAKARLESCSASLKLIEGNFGNLHSVLIENGVVRVDGGIMADLGMSAFQLTDAERGFSFQSDAPLDMRMSPRIKTTAESLVNTLPPKDLANLFYQNADEKFSRQIASAIVEARPVMTTKQLAKIAQDIYAKRGSKAQNIHPATRIFQALRMEVNREMAMLEQFLEQLPRVLLPGARVAIITFHSIEDRMVKQYFRLQSAECLCPPRQPLCTCDHKPAFKVIGKPVTPSEEEVASNPQARSAKLRIAERI